MISLLTQECVLRKVLRLKPLTTKILKPKATRFSFVTFTMIKRRFSFYHYKGSVKKKILYCFSFVSFFSYVH